jgi:hypothetical protein
MLTKKNTLLATLILASFSCKSDYELTGERPNVDPGDVTDCTFSPVSETKISAYDCNPVFQGTDEEWGEEVGSIGFYATEVLGHPFYQMWYKSASVEATLGSDSGFGMGYAVSANGTDWDTHPNNPLFENDPNAWDKDSVAGQVIVWDPIESQYIMAYQGITLGTGQFDPSTFEVDNGIWGLGIAKSKDGITWEKSARNPVIDFTAFEFSFETFKTFSPCWPLTITITRRGALKGYMAAADDSSSDQCNIYSMTATDADNWTIDESAPIFVGETEYDNKGFTSASVVEYVDPETQESTMYMFYIGFNEWEENTEQGYRTASNTTLNLATSTDDGVTWVRDENNPIQISKTGKLSNVAAQVIGDRIHLWVSDEYDGKNAVGYFLYEPKVEKHQ